MLAAKLQSDTKKIHSEVEKHKFVSLLLEDNLNSAAYFQHLIDLRYIYQTLESAFLHTLRAFPSLENIYFSELARQKYIEKDIQSQDFAHCKAIPSSAAIDYVNHLIRLQNEEPLRLLSHVYVRYLGDLSGGFILKKHIEKKWPHATNFYDFSSLLKAASVSTPFEYKKLFKTTLNESLVDSPLIEVLVEEAQLAFRFSESLFNAALCSTC